MLHIPGAIRPVEDVMIDWLGARRPIEIITLMTAALALVAWAVERFVVPMAGLFHA